MDNINKKIVRANVQNINIEIFKGINKNGKPIIYKLKPVEQLKKRHEQLNGVSFNKIQEAITSIQDQSNRVNSNEYFEQFDKKLLVLREKLNERKKNVKWYTFFIKFLEDKYITNTNSN